MNALARSSNYMAFDKRKKRTKLHYISLVTASYVDVLQRLREKIGASHKRALRITKGDNTSSFSELLEKDNSVSIYYKKLQDLTT